MYIIHAGVWGEGLLVEIPLCIVQSNLSPISGICQPVQVVVRHIGSLGVDHVVFSFCQAYPKSVRNMRAQGLEPLSLKQMFWLAEQVIRLTHARCWSTFAP